MKVSVIIPSFNEEKVIVPCIESLLKQSFEDMEIILVDDGSVDKTLQKVRKFKKQVKILKQNHLGAGAARNLGAKKAKGEILVFVDADMSFDNNFIKKLIDPIVKGKFQGTFSSEEFVSNWDNVWARCWNINEGWQDKKRHPVNYPDKQKVFRAIKKSEFEKVGGFDPGGYTDDYSLFEKLGYMAEKAEGAIFFHQNPDSLGDLFKQAKWVGKRQYKLGYLGLFVALVRASFPVSIIIGIYKSIRHLQPEFVIFKIIYDLGIFLGIVQYLFTGKGTK